MSLGARALRGAVWSSAGQFGQAAIGFGSTIVLVRLLGPEAFGLFTLGLLFTEFAEVLVARQTADFLVREKRVTRGHETAMFAVLCATALLLAGGIAAGAPQIAGFFDAPDLAGVLAAMAVLPILTALASVPQQILTRAMRFDTLAKIGTAAMLTGALSGVALAVAGAGIWSLVAMEAVRRAVVLAAAGWSARWLPGGTFGWLETRAVVVFGARRVENRLLQYVSINAIPRFLIGRYLGVDALGIYTVARRLLSQLNNVLNGPVTTVGFPVVSRLAPGDPAMGRFVTGALRLGTWIVWPAVLGIVAVAPSLVPLIYGHGWSEAVIVLQLLALGYLRAPLSGIVSAVLTGVGALGAISRLHVISMLAVAALLAAGLPFGLAGAAAALALRQWIIWPVGAHYVRKATGYDPRRQMRVLAGAAVPSLVMAAALMTTRWAIGPGPSHLATLLTDIALGVALYAVAWCAWNRVTPARLVSFWRLWRSGSADLAAVIGR